MTILKTALLGATICACAALAGGARAADLPIPPGYEMASTPLPSFLWTGAYAGADVGYVFDERTKFTAHDDLYPKGPLTTHLDLPDQSPRISDDGIAAGGHVGYNYQFGRFLVGVETDLSYLDTGKSVSSGDRSYDVTSRAGVDFLGTFRGRVGYTAGSMLFYGTGGLAYGDTFASVRPNGFYHRERDEVMVGYAAGGGVEFALGQNSMFNLLNSRGLTARIEYMHYDLGTSNLGSVMLSQPEGSSAYFRDKAHFSGDLVRTGVSYAF